jgi:hypothetical protein
MHIIRQKDVLRRQESRKKTAASHSQDANTALCLFYKMMEPAQGLSLYLLL